MSEQPTHKVVHTYGKVDKAYGLRMFTMAPEEDGPVFMVNFMKYKEVADYGAQSGEKISGQEADDRYAPVDVLARIGAYVAFHGPVVEQIGSQTPRWDRIGVVCYPTRKSFLEMQNRPDFQEKHVHKQAGMDQTFVIGCLPRTDVEPGDFRRENKGRHVVAVSAYRALEGTDVALITSALTAARAHAVAHGAQHGQWYDCEGTIMGDGRSFDLVCFDQYPDVESYRAAQQAIATDTACAALFDAAACDSYSVAAQPQIDRITVR